MREMERQPLSTSVGRLDRLFAVARHDIPRTIGAGVLSVTMFSGCGNFQGNECMQAPENIATLDSAVRYAVDSVGERHNPDTDDTQQAMAERIGVHFVEKRAFQAYKERFLASTSFEEAESVVAQFAKEYYGVTFSVLDDVDGADGYTFMPYAKDSYDQTSPLFGAIVHLNKLPQNIFKDMGFKDFKIQIAGDITKEDGDDPHGGLATYDKATHSTTITLIADKTLAPEKPPLGFYHEIGHGIDSAARCLDDDPQFENLDPDWLTAEERKKRADNNETLPEVVVGGNYGLGEYKEERADIYMRVLTGSKALNTYSSAIIKSKQALLLNRLYKISLPTAKWLWYSINYSAESS